MVDNFRKLGFLMFILCGVSIIAYLGALLGGHEDKKGIPLMLMFFFYSNSVIFSYLAKDDISVASAVIVKSGEYNHPTRVIGLFVGILFLILSIVGLIQQVS